MTDRKPSFVVTALLVAAGAALWLGLCAQLAMVPAVKRRFDEFGLQLPALTKLVLKVSDLVWANPWLAVPTVFGGLVVWVGLVGWLRHHRGWTVAVSVLAVLMIAGLVAGNLLVATGLILPEAKLREGLAK
jgi:type II secretory pathway component PulF